jgi:NTP pyrophosphatase (non-canonical NTP hydrolase)
MDDVQKEVMLIAQEECAEVTQAISKVFRFGMESEHNSKTNKQRLTEEVGDLLCMIELLMAKGVVDSMEVLDAKKNKYLKLNKWSNINGSTTN